MSMARIVQTSAIIFGAKTVMRMRTYTLKGFGFDTVNMKVGETVAS